MTYTNFIGNHEDERIGTDHLKGKHVAPHPRCYTCSRYSEINDMQRPVQTGTMSAEQRRVLGLD